MIGILGLNVPDQVGITWKIMPTVGGDELDLPHAPLVVRYDNVNPGIDGTFDLVVTYDGKVVLNSDDDQEFRGKYANALMPWHQTLTALLKETANICAALTSQGGQLIDGLSAIGLGLVML